MMNLEPGQRFAVERLFTQPQFNRFATLSGDDNPIHVDPEFSARTKFGRTVAHGMFLYASLCREVGEIAPGAVQIEQELVFPAPTFTGELVRLEMAVTECANGAARLSTDIVKADDSFGCQGTTLLATEWRAAWGAAAPPAPPALGENWKQFAVGQTASLVRTYNMADLAEYIDLLGEKNPLYTDQAFGRRLGLRGVPLPGALLGAMFSCLLGTELPGRGTNWLKQRFLFLRPAYPNEELTARVRVTRLRPEKELVNLRTWITGLDGALCCDGEALVWVSDVMPES